MKPNTPLVRELGIVDYTTVWTAMKTFTQARTETTQRLDSLMKTAAIKRARRGRPWPTRRP